MVMTSDREAAVLNLLIGRPVRTVSRSEILRSVWHAESTDPSVLDATMVRLRRRLQGTGLSIATVASRGYLLNGEVQACPAEVDLTEPGQVGAARGSRDTVRALALPRT
jgi:DNA-binding winged helix-turn-helix (wHTH) protein